MKTTIEEVNEELAACGCCEYPLWPLPEFTFESITASRSAVGWSANKLRSNMGYQDRNGFSYEADMDPVDRVRIFRKYVLHSEFGYPTIEDGMTILDHTSEVAPEAVYSGIGFSPNPTTTGSHGSPFKCVDSSSYASGILTLSGSFTTGGSEPFTEDGSIVFSIEVTPELLAGEVIALLASMGWGSPSGVSEVSSTTFGTSSATLVMCQAIFGVQDHHEGSYYRILVDIAEYPEGWDNEEEGAPLPSIVTADIERIWAGPGDPEDPDSWLLSPAIEIEPPTTPGIRKLVNGRCWGYRGTKTGILPRKFLDELV